MTAPSPAPRADEFGSGRPVVFRNAIVVTVDSPGIIWDGDVLVSGQRIEAVGTALPVPPGTLRSTRAAGSSPPGSSTPTGTCGRPRCAATAATGR